MHLRLRAASEIQGSAAMDRSVIRAPPDVDKRIAEICKAPQPALIARARAEAASNRASAKEIGSTVNCPLRRFR